MKKGFVFTMDVLVGLSILILSLLAFIQWRYETTLPEREYEKLGLFADDVMDLLTHLKVDDVKDRPTISEMISNGVVKDLNKTVLDLIASFWYAGNETVAGNISEEILKNVTEGLCASILIENKTIYSSCKTPGKNVAVSSMMETGYEVGKPTYGYVARAFLTSIRGKTTSVYAFFGGYEGDGNITKIINLPYLKSIESAYMELDVESDFSLYINGNFSGDYINGTAGGGNMTADKWQIDRKYLGNFTEGKNTITFNFTGERPYIGGGYLKVVYNTSQMITAEIKGIDRYYFPGINGIINLYSSFSSPGNLNSLNAYLHYKSKYATFLTIANATVFESNVLGEQKIYLSNSSILSNFTASGLKYIGLSNKTIPIRMGTRPFALMKGGNGDVILITDLSGSMDWRMDLENISGIERGCDDPLLNDPSTKRISVAKCRDREFVDNILNVSGNRVGLSAFYGDTDSPYKGRVISHGLSTNKTSLNNAIDGYWARGGTCICCAINDAYNILKETSNATREKFIVVMSDGIPTHDCQPGALPPGQLKDLENLDIPKYCYGNDTIGESNGEAGCYGGAEDCDTIDCVCPMNNANYSSCRAYRELNATVDSIGFGPVADCPTANWTLQAIAGCGKGTHYSSSNATELKGIYRKIAEKITEISYVAQIVNATNVTMDNILYPDSYIEFNYTPIVAPFEYGQISLTRETPRLNDSFGFNATDEWVEGSYPIPNQDVEVIDAKITSYSSEFWTDRLWVKAEGDTDWIKVYRLGDYVIDYYKLGDPYIVQIPADLMKEGKNNSVRIGTGITSQNATGGSPDDRLIYTIKVKGLVGYGNVFNSSSLALDDAIQRLIDKTKAYVDIGSENIATESEIEKGLMWLWGPSLIKIMVWENATI